MSIKLIIGIGAITVGLAALVLCKKKNPTLITVDILSAEKVITFFKRPHITTLLQQDKNLLAVAVKHKNAIITLACFNKATNTIQSEFISYRYKTLDDDLQTMFGDKDMLILS